MSDYDDWDGDHGGSTADSTHASHKPLPAKEEREVSNASGIETIAAIRASVGITKADPQRIDTTNIEAELEAMTAIRRKGNESSKTS